MKNTLNKSIFKNKAVDKKADTIFIIFFILSIILMQAFAVSATMHGWI